MDVFGIHKYLIFLQGQTFIKLSRKLSRLDTKFKFYEFQSSKPFLTTSFILKEFKYLEILNAFHNKKYLNLKIFCFSVLIFQEF